MSKTATIRIRIELSLKREVEDILAQLGLTTNALTARTLRASKAGKNVKRFGSKR